MASVRPAAVAGLFYPGDAGQLRREISALLRAAAEAQPANASATVPKAIIVPHAGYIYSAAIAASAYARLLPARRSIRRVVLLGPVHRVWVAGLALPGVDFFATPLGRVPIDSQAVEILHQLPQIETLPAAHRQEHSLEVHLPFLQAVLDDFSLVPLAVGGASPEAVAEVLDLLWGSAETLIVISSDLSHYLPYRQAQHTDQATVDAILAFDTTLHGEQACGAHPINGLLQTARRRGLQAELLDLRNSGDTAGDKDRVVGYAAIAFTEADHVD